MNIFRNNLKEMFYAVTPIFILVLIISLFYVDVPKDLLIKFSFGAVLIIIGLSIFLSGIHVSVEKIGIILGDNIRKFKNPYAVYFYGFFLGFIITVAEPDLMILAKSIEQITSINKYIIILAVSVGVGLLVGIGLIRILKNIPLKKMLCILYAITFIVFITRSDIIKNISFDASGATTGAMTTPFLISLAIGLARLKGINTGEKDSFGMVGLASIGPIIAVLILGFFTTINNSYEPTVAEHHSIIIDSIKEGSLALIPLATVFYIINFFSIKLNFHKLKNISLGLIYTFLGLTIFLIGVYTGFIELANTLGGLLFLKSKFVFVIFSIICGMLIVLAEPAVYALVDQVEDVTAGSIDRKLLLIALSLGVGFSMLLNSVRVIIPALQLWMYMLPVFAVVFLLIKKVNVLFVGISFDAGGVASGPMTATFVLALMQGASQVSGNVVAIEDGFGVIASVAMAPILTLMILGYIYKRRSK